MICNKEANKLGLIVTLGNIIINISNNICATTALCVHGSGAWTGRNLILDEGLWGPNSH